MTKTEFDQRVLSLLGVLHSVSYSLLPNPEDQADAVQECVKKALQKRHTLRDAGAMKTWLLRILVNECHNIGRHKQRTVPVADVEIKTPPEADRAVFEALMELPEKLRLPVVLHHIEGYNTSEVSEILRIPVGTVKGRLVRGRKQLYTILKEEEAWACAK